MVRTKATHMQDNAAWTKPTATAATPAFDHLSQNASRVLVNRYRAPRAVNSSALSKLHCSPLLLNVCVVQPRRQKCRKEMLHVVNHFSGKAASGKVSNSTQRIVNSQLRVISWTSP